MKTRMTKDEERAYFTGDVELLLTKVRSCEYFDYDGNDDSDLMRLQLIGEAWEWLAERGL